MMNTTEASGTFHIFGEGNFSRNGSTFVLKISPTLNKTIDIFTVTILFITMISLGCTMELSKIKAHLLKPKGVAIALLAQFGIMPLMAFSLAKLLQMDPVKAVTVLICGCCPGGTLSNIFSLAFKGDMNLSIVMTTCSSVASLGMMPLLLYVFCQGFPGLENAVPYGSIMKALVFTLVPCAAGILINHYKPKYSPLVKKAGLSILIISSIVVSVLSAVAVKGVLWMIVMPDVLLVAALMPLIGFMLGYLMSVACKLSAQCSRTISMETVYITAQCSEAVLLALCYRCYQTVRQQAEDGSACNSVEIKQEARKRPCRDCIDEGRDP